MRGGSEGFAAPGRGSVAGAQNCVNIKNKKMEGHLEIWLYKGVIY